MSTISRKITNEIGTKITNEKRFIQVKASDLFSIFTIFILSCIVVIFSALVFDMIIKINKSSAYTVVYDKAVKEEESTVLRIDL